MQLSNQFAMTSEKGLLSLTYGSTEAVIKCQVVSTEATALVAGQAVKLSDTLSKTIEVTAVTVTTNAVFGIVVYDIKSSSKSAKDMLDIAINGSVVLMEAGAAIARGAKLEYTVVGQKVATQATGTTIGTALDKAAASGDLVRVLITTNGQ